MLIKMKHNKTNKIIITGNAHLFWKPTLDHVKFGQAYHLVDLAAAYIR